jgi:hypothetical protein
LGDELPSKAKLLELEFHSNWYSLKLSEKALEVKNKSKKTLPSDKC